MRLLLLSVLLLLGACGRGGCPACLDGVAAVPDGSYFEVEWDDDSAVHITFDDGTSQTYAEPARRVVSTLPGITEMLAFLGASDLLVGVSPHCDTPADVVETLQRVSVMPLDVEAILALEPDLVLVDRTLFRSQLPELRGRIPGLLAIETSRSLDALSQSMTLVAALVGGLDRAIEWSRRLEQIEGQISKDNPEAPPRVLVVSMWDPLNVLGPGALIDDCLRICGCINIACDLKGASNTFDEELVIVRRPEWILHRADAVPDWVASRWWSVPAVVNGKIGPCETNDLSRGGPRILDALERLAAVLRARAPMETLVPGAVR